MRRIDVDQNCFAFNTFLLHKLLSFFSRYCQFGDEYLWKLYTSGGCFFDLEGGSVVGEELSEWLVIECAECCCEFSYSMPNHFIMIDLILNTAIKLN